MTNYKVFIIIISVFQVWLDNSKGDLLDSKIIFESDESDVQFCETTTGITGKCTEIKDCQGINLNSEHPKICSWEGHLPIICCPASLIIKRSKLTANPECGIRPNDPKLYMKRDITNVKIEDGALRDDNSNPKFVKAVVGKNGTLFSWPWMVSIHQRTVVGERFLCGGCIISDLYVLSAAHCFGGNPALASDYLIKYQGINRDMGINEDVENILLHPGYKNGEFYNDIAIITLKNSILFDDKVSPACLSTENIDYLSRKVTVLGWGDMSYGGRYSGILQEATFDVIPNDVCNASYSKLKQSALPKGVTQDFLCAGLFEEGKSACQSDSGGPLMTREFPSLRWTVIGIVSFGYQCGSVNFPGIYARVYNYLQWISDNTNLIVI